MRATLTRTETGVDGTFGVLRLDSGFECRTVELPWRGNAPDVSCVPPGTYSCVRRYSPRHEALLYHVDGVPGRTDVEIHAANWGGDVAQGRRSDLKGCLGPGADVVLVEGQRGVLNSRQTLLALEVALSREPFDLTIAWAPGIGPVPVAAESKEDTP